MIKKNQTATETKNGKPLWGLWQSCQQVDNIVDNQNKSYMMTTMLAWSQPCWHDLIHVWMMTTMQT